MPDLPIEERLVHYFLAMGAQQSENVANNMPGVTFILGSEKIHVSILNNADIAQRSRIIETLLGLASLRTVANQVYLAAPKLLGATIDAAVFRSQGIGVLLFDERRIEEPVSPKSFQPLQQQLASPASDPKLLSELAALKEMYLQMEKSIESLREDLKNFQESSNRVTVAKETSLRNTKSPKEIFISSHGGADQLPSFFANNPWLEVLAKRGKMGEEPIAG